MTILLLKHQRKTYRILSLFNRALVNLDRTVNLPAKVQGRGHADRAANQRKPTAHDQHVTYVNSHGAWTNNMELCVEEYYGIKENI